jgi:hypothetical protein
MAKRKATRARPANTIPMTLRLPRPVWDVITEAAMVARLTPDQVVSAILALRFVTMKSDVRP